MQIETGRRSVTALSTAAVALVLGISEAWAAAGRPSPWEMGMQDMVTELGQSVSNFHTYLVWLIAVICLFVLALLLVIVARFNENKNPVPSKTTHNTLLEVAWTIVPVLILVAIAIPSFRLLRQQLVPPQADIVVKATGYSWYWGYEYPADQGGGFKFDSNMIAEAKDLKPDQPRLLGADNAMVVPVGKVVRVQVTSADVHPRLRHAVLLHQDRRGSRPPERDLVQGRQGRRLLRPVLRALRQRPSLHADRNPCRERAAIMPLG